MKKLFYIGAMSALLLAACGEEKVEETDKAQEELDKAKEKEVEQANKEAELKAKEEEERKAKEVEEKAGDLAEKEITVNEAKEIFEDWLSENDKLVSLTIENGEIKAVINLGPNKFNLPLENMAVTSYSSVSDALLEEEGWNTLTIEYVGVGTVSMDISEKESNELGMNYFPVATITEKLK
ncbi:hypothetical protein [Lysinibacillus sp. NPDC093692]|uniref:hypothetical protein n=1 Tax=Lysinibacillus sp. NPDC093692 TaxID=3390578 RepID=UPI003D056B38